MPGRASHDIKVDRVSGAIAAAQTAVQSASVNMAGYDGVMFVALTGTIDATAVTSINVQQSSDDGSADAFADLLGTKVAIADDDDNKAVLLDVYQPKEQYVRCAVVRGTADAAFDCILAIRYGAHKKPVAQGAAALESHDSPAEGTA